jgi:hypothetical protein
MELVMPAAKPPATTSVNKPEVGKSARAGQDVNTPAVKARKKPGPAKGTPSKKKRVFPEPVLMDVPRRIYELAAVGATLEQIATVLRIPQTTFRDRMRVEPELSDAYKNGRADTIAFVSGKLMENIRAGNPASIFFFLKCQANWRETNNLNLLNGDALKAYTKVSDETRENILPALTDEELDQLQVIVDAAEKRMKEMGAVPEGKAN